jgi:KDO2-lipid IV(A) lauroyltransferase
VSLVSIANSRWGPAAGMRLVRLLRPRLSRRLAEWAALRVSRQTHSAAVAAVRSNSAVVLGLAPDHPQVQQTVETIFKRATRSFVSLFETMGKGYDGLRTASGFDQELLDTAIRRIEQGSGMLYVGCHTVGFDHLFLLMGSLEYPIQVLAYPETEGSYSVLNRIRRQFGADLSPIDYHSLRRAIHNLRGGGIVLTGVDRPDPRGQPLDFFGRKAMLPTGHARLALRTGAPIMVGASSETESGRYRGQMLALVESTDFLDRPDAEVALAQRIVTEFEGFIRGHPDQWMMFYPVWPDGGEAVHGL